MKPMIELGEKPMKILSHCATKIAGPQNRLILGATALATQPLIDYYNKNVDEKTRKYAVCKTIAKIIVGTTVGVMVRSCAIKYSSKFLHIVDLSKINKQVTNNIETRKILQNTIGDILALGVCLVTNFLIDAPLTKLGTNYLAKKFIKEEK